MRKQTGILNYGFCLGALFTCQLGLANSEPVIPDCQMGVVHVEILSGNVAQFKSMLEMRSAFPPLIVLEQVDGAPLSHLRVSSLQDSIPDGFAIAGVLKSLASSFPDSMGVKKITADYCFSDGSSWPDSLSNIGTIGH